MKKKKIIVIESFKHQSEEEMKEAIKNKVEYLIIRNNKSGVM